MTQALLWGLTFSAAFAVTGCPVFPDDNNACMSSAECAPGYACDLESGFCHLSPSGGNGTCSAPSDCGTNETCGRDSLCHTGSCRIETTGCVDGYSCEIVVGAWACVPIDGGSSVGSGGSVGAAGAANGGSAGATSGTGGTSGDGGASLGGAAGAASGSGGSSLGGAAGAAGAPAAAGQAGAG